MLTRLLAALAWLVASAAGAAPLVRGVDSVGLTVADLDRSVAFYTGVLGFRRESDVALAGEGWERLEGVAGLRMRVARLRLGDEAIELTEYVAPAGRPAPADARSNDRWFQHVAIVVRDMDAAWRTVTAHGVRRVSPAPQRLPDWNPDAGGIEAVYLRDPDGHPLELIRFPAGKGDPRWQGVPAHVSDLFLGIDHTAIAVADTETSLRFYRDALGLRVAGESRNRGPEQERLNDVAGAHLRITGLRAAMGPGIELLEYLAPRDGRPFPAGERANDLVHWHTRLVADGAAVEPALRSLRTLRAAGALFVSPGAVRLPGRELGFASGLTVRDPDGHVLQVTHP